MTWESMSESIEPPIAAGNAVREEPVEATVPVAPTGGVSVEPAARELSTLNLPRASTSPADSLLQPASTSDGWIPLSSLGTFLGTAPATRLLRTSPPTQGESTVATTEPRAQVPVLISTPSELATSVDRAGWTTLTLDQLQSSTEPLPPPIQERSEPEKFLLEPPVPPEPAEKPAVPASEAVEDSPFSRIERAGSDPASRIETGSSRLESIDVAPDIDGHDSKGCCCCCCCCCSGGTGHGGGRGAHGMTTPPAIGMSEPMPEEKLAVGDGEDSGMLKSAPVVGLAVASLAAKRALSIARATGTDRVAVFSVARASALETPEAEPLRVVSNVTSVAGLLYPAARFVQLSPEGPRIADRVVAPHDEAVLQAAAAKSDGGAA